MLFFLSKPARNIILDPSGFKGGPDCIVLIKYETGPFRIKSYNGDIMLGCIYYK